MREHRSTSLFLPLVFLMGFSGCVADSAKSPSDTVAAVQTEEGKDQPASGEVQERAVPGRMAPGPLRAPAPGEIAKSGDVRPIKPEPIGPIPLPGEFVIATAAKGALLFAAYGGGRTNDALVTPLPSGISVNTKFRLYAASPPAPAYKYIQTVNGYFLMAPDGGGRTTSDAIVTDLHQYPYGVYTDIAKFRFGRLGQNGNAITIQTINGNFVTAVGGGGQLTNAFHTDAKTAQSWEYFSVVKCGDLGSGFTYALYDTGTGVLSASGGGGSNTRGHRDGGGHWFGPIHLDSAS